MQKQVHGNPVPEGDGRRRHPSLPGPASDILRWKEIRARRPSPGRLYLSIILMVLLVVAASPAAAHSMAGGVDYVNGIDNLWPFHATLMTGGISAMLVATGIVRFGRRKTTWWYKIHPVVALTGAALAIGAIGVAFTMVANSHQPHLQYFHGWFGSFTIVIIIAAPLIMIFRRPIAKKLGRSPAFIHRAAGFSAIGLMAVNILLGLSMMHVI